MDSYIHHRVPQPMENCRKGTETTKNPSGKFKRHMKSNSGPVAGKELCF